MSRSLILLQGALGGQRGSRLSAAIPRPRAPPSSGSDPAGGAGPPVAIDATHTKLDVGRLYLAALKRANGVVDGGNSINGGVGAASDLTE